MKLSVINTVFVQSEVHGSALIIDKSARAAVWNQDEQVLATEMQKSMKVFHMTVHDSGGKGN